MLNMNNLELPSRISSKLIEKVKNNNNLKIFGVTSRFARPTTLRKGRDFRPHPPTYFPVLTLLMDDLHDGVLAQPQLLCNLAVWVAFCPQLEHPDLMSLRLDPARPADATFLRLGVR